MPKRQHTFHDAFTLIEVMLAVMIVSVVIAALLQMRGETTHKFFGIKKMMQTNQYNTFLLGESGRYGFEKSSIHMDRLVESFDLERDLRQKLKALKVELRYTPLKTIDTAEFDDGGSGIIFEIGDTSLVSKEFTLHMMRVRVE